MIFETSVIIITSLHVITEKSRNFHNFKIIATNCTVDDGTNSGINNESDNCHTLFAVVKTDRSRGKCSQRCSNRGSSVGAGSSSSDSGSRVE